MIHKDPPALRKYLRQVRSWLPCPGSMKRMILADIRENALDFLRENPEAGCAHLEERFGTPDRLAASYIQDMDTHRLLRNLRLSRRVTRIVIAALIAACLIWTAGVIACTVDFYSQSRGYHVITPPEVYQEPIT